MAKFTRTRCRDRSSLPFRGGWLPASRGKPGGVSASNAAGRCSLTSKTRCRHTGESRYPGRLARCALPLDPGFRRYGESVSFWLSGAAISPLPPCGGARGGFASAEGGQPRSCVENKTHGRDETKSPPSLPAMRLANAPLKSVARKIAAESPPPQGERGLAAALCPQLIPGLRSCVTMLPSLVHEDASCRPSASRDLGCGA